MREQQTKWPRLVQEDPWLEPHAEEIQARIDRFEAVKASLERYYGGLYEMAGAHHYLGFHYDEQRKGWFFREWAPAAYEIFLVGDFNDWDRTATPLYKHDNGIWEIFLDDATYAGRLVHGTKFKLLVHSAIGWHERIPAYVRRVEQNTDSPDFHAVLWAPEPFDWQGDDFQVDHIREPYIYEVHVGMSLEKEGVASYREFEEQVLPRIRDLGYNTIQLMAVQEHPYYGSFGYHVSNFFAVSSRFGTPEDLKHLIRTAHSMGIAVVMDIVHSHAVKNFNEGLNQFDGTVYQYFHDGGRGEHPDWDSKLFNYGKWEVMQMLLSNVRFWIEEFHFDGFRFDGVTSMLYQHHGHKSFSSYSDYFGGDVDLEALTYLQLANTLAHQIKPGFMSIAEDVSGMPGLSRPVLEGGVGFDYRLAMGLPDFWVKVLKEQTDEDWNMWDFWSAMVNRRWNEKTIAYAESHDQALVGDKTVAFWLMDQEMYWGMDNASQNLVVDRGVALHKMIRMLTLSLGGDGYLNFIGNEFGHPEWIDFPREGNGWSFKYARRQWSLADNGFLRYQKLNNFDRAMIHFARMHDLLDLQPVTLLNVDNSNKTIAFKRGRFVFVFNFHPTASQADYRFSVQEHGKFKLVFSSDASEFGGFGRLNFETEYFTDPQQVLSIYNINRTVMVFENQDALPHQRSAGRAQQQAEGKGKGKKEAKAKKEDAKDEKADKKAKEEKPDKKAKKKK